ncbi:MAG TPA: hypothetical protein VFZ55_03320 [Nitrososphaera sp.]
MSTQMIADVVMAAVSFGMTTTPYYFLRAYYNAAGSKDLFASY